MSQERIMPPIAMKVDLTKFDETEPVKLPEGYTLRTFCESEDKADERAWDSIIAATFKDPECTMEKLMYPDPAYEPSRIFFVCYQGEPVATAAGWFIPEYGEDCGHLHMVAALPEHAGKGLGIAVTRAAMQRLKRDGKVRGRLNTDDFRLPAIKAYLRLGWEPQIVGDNQYDRWKIIYEKLDWKAAPPVREE